MLSGLLLTRRGGCGFIGLEGGSRSVELAATSVIGADSVIRLGRVGNMRLQPTIMTTERVMNRTKRP